MTHLSKRSLVLNKPEVTSIEACAELRNTGTEEAQARIRFTIHALDDEEILTSAEVETRIPAQSKATLRSTLSYPDAKLWSAESPTLYRLQSRSARNLRRQHRLTTAKNKSSASAGSSPKESAATPSSP